jgi:hypothetical protein
MTTYIDAKYVSAELKRRLVAEFPGVKFSVRRGRGTGCAGIHVHWTDGPSSKDVAPIARAMQGSSWNGMDERYEETGNTVTVTIDGQRVTGRPVVDSVSVQQEISPEVLAEAAALWHEEMGEDTDRNASQPGFTCQGEWIGGTWGHNQIRDIAQAVVLPARWQAARAAAQAPAPAPAEPAAPAAQAPEAEDGAAVTVAHTDADGVVVTGTQRGDGAAPVLKAQGLKWHRQAGYWYLPGSRGPAGAEHVERVSAALRAAGLSPAPAAEQQDAPAEESHLEEAAPAVEAPAAQEPAAEESRKGLEAGAHRIYNTGRTAAGAGMAYEFQCLHCHQAARMVEFEELPCTDEAEAAYTYAMAARLLDDVGLREARAFEVVHLGDGTGPHSRPETVVILARHLQAGASHRWHDRELRLARGGQEVTIIRPASPLLGADGDDPGTYRGVPVPPGAADWSTDRLMAWCAGADAALAYAFPPPAAA